MIAGASWTVCNIVFIAALDINAENIPLLGFVQIQSKGCAC